MLNTEYKDTIDSVRSLFGNYMAWFSFFTGVNLAGYGWFAKQLMDDAKGATWVILIVCIYFVFQHILAWYATGQLVQYLKNAKGRLELILPEISKDSDSPIKPEVGCPMNLYIISVTTLKATFPSMVFLWVAFTIFSFVAPMLLKAQVKVTNTPAATASKASGK